ncbi:FAD-dependent oxidoreductase [Niveibacterium sp. SC-1]|uniref:FAD-dependent oxidoreductase n=1 Tax=Niveibacterium sp. SC-1 TaxID=3135646 RepID=UPI00311ED962
MITIEDLLAVPILESVSRDDLARLAGSSGDVRLSAGEYAVHQGGERALFIVISGRIEVTKSIDGIERVIGARAPGQIFGEVPITFGMPFQGSYRATEATRVMHVAARDFHALAATNPEVLTRVATLASERIGGLRGIATAQPRARAVMLGHRWDDTVRELRSFLTRNQISYDWVLPDAPDRTTRWSGPTVSDEELPALVCDDGTVLKRATCRDVAERLGLQTRPRVAEYDTVIIGGGPAGLAAAVYGASEGLRTLVIEREAPGGQAETSSRIENYLGFPTGVSGEELARRALQQATRLGAEIAVTRSAVSIDPATMVVTLDGAERVRARTIILATGVTWRRLSTEGFDRLLGRGVFYGASRSEAASTQGQDIHLIGAGNSAGQAALFFASHARSVTLVVRGGGLEKSMSRYLIEQVQHKANIATALNSEITAAHGDKHLASLDLSDRSTGSTRRVESGGVFVFIGADAETTWLPDAIVRDERGYIRTGDPVARSGHWPLQRDPYLLETSVPGIFACGDVRTSPIKRVAAAVGEGSMAIAFVHQFLAQQARA